MTSLVKVNLTEHQVALLRSEIEDSRIFISKFKREDYEITQVVPTWFGMSSREVKSYDVNRLEKELPKYVQYEKYKFNREVFLWVEWTRSGEIIREILEMSLAGKDLYLTSECTKVLNEVLGGE